MLPRNAQGFRSPQAQLDGSALPGAGTLLPHRPRRLLPVFIAMAVLVIGAILTTYLICDRVIRRGREVAHHRAVLKELVSTISTIKDAETGQRGFLLTGNESYLEPYSVAVAHIQEELDALRGRGTAGHLPENAVGELADLWRRKREEMETTIHLRREAGLQPALEIVESDAGRRTMDAIRRVMGELESQEEDKLQEAARSGTRSAMLPVVVFLIAGLPNLLFMGWAYARVRREISRREAAMAEIARQKAEVGRQKDLLSVTLASIGDAVIVTDVEGRVTFMNGIAQELTGWGIEEARGAPLPTVFKIIQEGSRREIESPVTKVLREGTVQGLANHTLLVRKDGREISIDDSGAPIRDREGVVWGVVLVFRDFTEKKEAERALHAAKSEAEASSRAKDSFLAALSHELRTPLTPVLFMLSKWESQAGFPATLIPDVQMLRRNVELEARLIDDLLDLTRIAKGKLPLSPEVIDVHQLLESVTEMCREDLNSKGLSLSMPLEARRPFVHADPARMQQVFWNVLKNAIKFTGAGGRIEISTADGADGNLRIAFADSGIGMSEETLARIFQPFQQGEPQITRRYGGLGLGMAITKALVDAQGGVITARSEGASRGSTFIVSLPSVDAPASQRRDTSPRQAPATAMRSRRILLVEDHPDTADVMALLLRQLGHQVQTADTVARATSLLREGEFDLLLSDIGLPDGTGIDLIREVHRLRPIPAIALTGFGMEEDVARCRDAGFVAHLTKPVGLQDLQAALSQATRVPLDP